MYYVLALILFLNGAPVASVTTHFDTPEACHAEVERVVATYHVRAAQIPGVTATLVNCTPAIRVSPQQ